MTAEQIAEFIKNNEWIAKADISTLSVEELMKGYMLDTLQNKPASAHDFVARIKDSRNEEWELGYHLGKTEKKNDDYKTGYDEGYAIGYQDAEDGFDEP